MEVAVQIVTRYVLGRLRHRRCFSLDELNAAVRDCVTALKPLPAERYQYAAWRRCTAAPDYHAEVDGHYYSVPYRLLRESVNVPSGRRPAC